MAEKGRPNRTQPFTDTVPEKSALQAILVKQDEIIQALKDLTAKMDADFADVTNASVDYASSITDALEKVDLK